MNTTQYAMAHSFFYEADLRKKGYHFLERQVLSPGIVEVLDHNQIGTCEIDTLKLAKNDVMGHFLYAVQALKYMILKQLKDFIEKQLLLIKQIH